MRSMAEGFCCSESPGSLEHEFVLRLEHLLNVLKFRQKDTREERANYGRRKKLTIRSTAEQTSDSGSALTDLIPKTPFSLSERFPAS